MTIAVTLPATGARNVPPAAAAMIESLRGLGYTTATALADIIDNSVSAGARNVEVDFVWDGDRSHIRILDDGTGMSDAELEQAMRLGARDPREKRGAHDLGRFGLGLKTASFSQAQRLTVASRRAGGPCSCLRWDLVLLANAAPSEWPLLEGASPGSEHLIAPLEARPSGTIVLWELLDRIVTPGFGLQDMNALLDETEAHLAMVFHRMLDGSGPGFVLNLNGRPVKPWDPFLIGHPGKGQESTVYQLPGEVTVQCHVLPHRDLLKTAEQQKAAGPAGWTSQEGFYVYRQRRLLVAGGWLGLGERGRQWTRDEPHRLARIRVDIPNTADVEWKINVLKSRASVPVRLRSDLQRLASVTRETARRVFANRGRVAVPGARTAGLPDLWSARISTKGTSYRIDREHDLVRKLTEGGASRGDVEALLRLIEETLPVQRIWLDTAEERETPRNGFVTVPPEETLSALRTYYETLTGFRGMDPDDAKARLARTPPFDAYPELVARLGSESESG